MKVQATKEDLQSIILGAAVLKYLEDIFYENYPEGVPELAVFEDKIDMESADQEELHNKLSEELVHSTVANLKTIAEKYNAI